MRLETFTSCRAPNVECCHTWSSIALQERDGHGANNVNVASTQLQTKVAIGFLTGLLRVQVGCMGGEKGQSPHQVRAHSLGFFALSSRWHWQFLSVAKESQSGPLVRNIESLKFKSSFGCHSAGPLVEALSRHLQSLSPQSEFASLLQNSSSWVGGEHLSGAVQEMCIPAHVSQSLEIWLAQQCAQFGQSVPTVIPADHPSRFLQSSESIPLPRSPFQNVPLAEERPSVSSAGGSSPMQVSHPFVTVPDVAEGVQYSTPAPQSLNHTLNFQKEDQSA